MSVFTESWSWLPEQQQFPPASPEGRGAGGHGSGDKGDGPEGPGPEDPSEGFTGPGGAADSPSRGGPTGGPEGRGAERAAPAPAPAAARDEDTLTAPRTSVPAPPSMDQIAARKSALAEKHGFDIADLTVAVNARGELEFGAKGAGYGRAMDLARPTDPFAAAFHDLTVALSPFATKAAGHAFGIGIDEMTGAAQPTGFAGADQDPMGPDWGPPDDSVVKPTGTPEQPTQEKPPGTQVLPPPYVSPVDREGAGQASVQQFLETMREQTARAAGRLARV